MFKLIKSGIPQGSVLGPILFALYDNDTPFVHPEVSNVSYADDTVLLISDNNLERLIINASNIFTEFSLWFAANKLTLNDATTYFVVFLPPRYDGIVLDTLHFDDHVVKRAACVRYLDFLIDSKRTWCNHLTYICDKVNKGVGMLKRCCYILPQKCLFAIYYAVVYPFLTLGIEFWGCQSASYHVQPLHVAKMCCIKIISHAESCTHSPPLAKKLNLLMLNDLHNLYVLSFMYKVYTGDICDAIKTMFTKLIAVHNLYTKQSAFLFYLV